MKSKRLLVGLALAAVVLSSIACDDSEPVVSAPVEDIDLVDAGFAVHDALEDAAEATPEPPSWLDCKVMKSNCSNCTYIGYGRCNVVILGQCVAAGHISDEFQIKQCE